MRFFLVDLPADNVYGRRARHLGRGEGLMRRRVEGTREGTPATMALVLGDAFEFMTLRA